MKAQSSSGIAVPSMPQALDVIGGQQHPLTPLPQESPGTLCAQLWVGFGIDLDGCQTISKPPAFEPQTIQPIQRVAIPTVLFQLYLNIAKL